MSENPFAQFVKPQEKKEENPFAQFVQKQPQKEQTKGITGHLQDAGASLMKGLVAVPEAIVGLADIHTGGHVGNFIEKDIGLDLKGAKEYWGDKHTDQYKEQQKYFEQADGILEKGKVALSNPSMIANTIVESVPSIFLGGAAAKGLGAVSKLGAVTRGAIGEGAVMAGQQAASIRGETEDGLLTPEQSGLSVATGALGSLFGFAGGKIAKKMGFDDLDTAMASGKLNSQHVGESIQKIPLSSVPKSIVGGALSEGLLEELPQSVSEQLLQNIALDRPLDEGLDGAIVMGALAGMAMGGGMNTVSAPMSYVQNNRAYDEQQALAQEGYEQPSDIANSRNQTTEQPSAEQSTQVESMPTDYNAQGAFSDSVSGLIERQDLNEARNRIENAHAAGLDTTDATSQFNDLISQEYQPIQTTPQHDDLNAENPQLQTKSQKLGINPNDGPLSSAAALAVDSGASLVSSNGDSSAVQQDSQIGNTSLGNTGNTFVSTEDRYNLSDQWNAGILADIDAGNIESARQKIQQAQEQGIDVNHAVMQLHGRGIGDSKSLEQYYQNKANTLQTESSSLPVDIENPSASSEQDTQANVNQQNQSKTDQPITFAQKIADAHLNDPKLKPQLIQQEVIETGRTRKDVLQEVSRVIEGQQNISNDMSENVSRLAVQGRQITQLEKALENTKHVSERKPIREQLKQLKSEQNAEADARWQGMSPQQRKEIVKTVKVPPAIEEKIPSLPWEKLAPPLQKKLINAINQQPTQQQEIETSANEAATSPLNDIPEPSQAQIEAGNYKKGHIRLNGLDISIENPKGSTRSGNRPDGTQWEHTMSDHYGYIKRTKGADNEHIDTYIGSKPNSDQVFIVDQLDQETGSFDEHKVMLGFDSQEAATKAYQSNFDKGWKVGPIRNMNMEQFKDWLKNGDTSKPVTQKNVKDSIESIRAEKIRQKDLADMHSSVYGLANDEQLQESFNHLNKEIAKSRKAVKNQNASTKQDSNIPQYSRSINESNKTNNFNNLEEWKEFAKNQRVSISAHESGDLITLNKIVVPVAERNNGIGSRIMQALIDYADSHNKHIALTPSSDFGGNAVKLKSFYKRFGFIENKGGNKVYQTSEAMYREVEGKTLYSHSTKNSSGSTIQQVRDTLVERFGKDTIYELERQGKLEIIQDYSVEGVEGFYHNGKAVLVASNLTSQSIVPTFLHELSGHAGFQNMMSQKQYNELMSQFNKLVEQGNPVARAAKLLAEREQDSERQQLEYLPYLLTLSSTMQQRNILQRNALQKLINNIVTYVKASLFDNFGINLNLNPDDMVALAERMIDKAANSSYSEKTDNSAQYSLNENSHAPFQKAIDDVVAGNTPTGFINMGKTPDVLKMLGLPDTKVSIKGATIEKVMGEHLGTAQGNHSNLHNLTPDTLRQIPKQLNNPIAVFKSAQSSTNASGYVILTELTETDVKTGKDKPVIVALELDTSRSGIQIATVRSIYGRSFSQMQTAIDGDVLYWHKEKGQQFINAFGLQLSSKLRSDADLSTANIKTNEDLVKYENQPLYSRKAFEGTIDALVNNIQDLGRVKQATKFKMTDALKHGLAFLNRRQLTEIYQSLLPQMKTYNEIVQQMDADKNDIAANADGLAREWGKLKDEKQLADVMHSATLAQIDPARTYQTGDDKAKYHQLSKQFNALSPEAKEMYIKARDAYAEYYSQVRQAVKERIQRSALSSQRKADLIKKMDAHLGQIKGVYFPLARFGQYVVVVRDKLGNTVAVSRAETMGQANALRMEMLKEYPNDKVDPVILDKAFNRNRDKVGRGFMGELFDAVDDMGLAKKQQAEFEDTLNQLWLNSLPDLSWAKHAIHRKGTAGFSQDARRAFAQSMTSGASHLAKLRYSDMLVEQLDKMKEYADNEVKANSNYNHPLAGRVIDEMEKRHENMMNSTPSALSSALTSMGFFYFLGLSPAAAMVNLMQTPLVAYPLMGAKFGFDKAGAALLKASVDYAKGVDIENKSLNISDSFNKEEKAAYDEALRRGVIDITQAHDLAGIANGEDSGVMYKTRPLMRAASFMFHHAERFNREVTFIAAFRLAKEKGLSNDAALEQAIDLTYKGHFDYSASNRARFMQSNVAKVVFLFKQFGQNMIYTIARQSYIALIGKNHTKEERIEAARAISAILTTHAMAAGVLGLPMVTTMLAVASMLGGSDDEPWDAEVALRNGLADMTSPTFSNLMMKGLSRGTPADISGRVGLDSMFLPQAQDGLEGQKLYEQLLLGNLGATVGMGANIAKGLQEMGNGNYKRGLEEMLPLVLKNPMKALRYADEGVQDKTGKEVLSEVSGAGVASQFIGFSPSEVRTAYEGKSAIYQNQQTLQKRRSSLMDKWVRAKRKGDSETMTDAWEDIKKFNRSNPKLRINHAQLMQSYRMKNKMIREADQGVYLSKRYADSRELGRFAIGE